MAEINSEQGGKKGKKKGSKKASTKVDMTPMVDLAFLLITFFMLTTTFGKSQTMQVNMPDKTEDRKKQEIKESQTLTILLGSKDEIFYFQGLEDPELVKSDFSSKGIRQVLIEKNSSIKDLVVLVKATEDSRYKNMVDILDELSVVDVERYAIADITTSDLQLIENFREGGSNE